MMKNRRRKSFALLILAAGLLVLAAVLGSFWKEAAIQTDFTRKNLAPCIRYPFGTDWMGRDMFVRTIAGLSLSIRIGLLTAAVSAAAAFLMGLCAAVCGKAADSIVQMLIDIVMGIPHMLLLILISFACGRGFWGVVWGIAFTHWASLARLIRGEVLQLKQSQYVKIAEKLGKGKFYIAFCHMAPNLIPQFITGLVLLFPHASQKYGKRDFHSPPWLLSPLCLFSEIQHILFFHARYTFIPFAFSLPIRFLSACRSVTSASICSRLHT